GTAEKMRIESLCRSVLERPRMEASDLIQILKGAPDFAQVDERSLGELVGAGSLVEPAVGEDIVRQGEVGEQLWILIEGDLEVLVDGEFVNRVSRPGEP